MTGSKYLLITFTLLMITFIIVLIGKLNPAQTASPEAGFRVNSGRLHEAQRSVGFTPVDTKTEETTLTRLFEEMGVVQMEPVALPVEVTLPDLNGRQVSLSDFKGKILFVNFWATWCPPCREEMPSMEKLYTRLKHRDFAIVAIDMQEPASKVEAFFKEFKLTFMALMDSNGEVGLLFGIRSIPTTLILDKKGMIIGIAVGARDWASKKSIALFEYLIDQPVEISSRSKTSAKYGDLKGGSRIALV